MNRLGAYGSYRFPFYNLHARQYLMIALCRVSVDHPALLISYKETFYKYSLLEPHILIQKFSSDITVNIEKAFPGTYSNIEASILSEINKGKKETRYEEHGYQIDSYLHTQGKVETTLEYNFNYDINQYWFESLGRVFGVPRKQVKELCANVIINEWGIRLSSDYVEDLRAPLWLHAYGDETRHSQGTYPKVDNYDFYLSYHSIFVVAAKLFNVMPVIVNKDDYGNEINKWHLWLSRHLLTRGDCKWLADYKGPVPLKRPDWVFEENKNTWRVEIRDQHFLKCIHVGDEMDWLVVKGGWEEREGIRYETYSVSSALVSKDTSEALLRALSTCSDPNDYKLPDFEEDNMEFQEGKFQLKGWISNPYTSKGIDQHDPYGAGIDYPPLSPGYTFKEKLGLSEGLENKVWYLADGDIALKCNAWSSNLQGHDEESPQSGMQLRASREFLKKLCRSNNCNLIIKVSINRDIKYKYRSEANIYEYKTHSKVYLFKKDGRLTSVEKNN